MCAINYGHANGSAEYSDNARCRTCLHHLHSSVITFDSSDRHRLKIGAAPAMCSIQCTVENELHKENSNLPRIVGSPEDLQHAHICEMKIKNEINERVAATATPTRDS